MTKKLGKYLFILKNIDHSEICKKYSINILTNIDLTEEIQPEKTTKISELSDNNNIPQIVSFLSESKSIIKCNVIMYDISSKNIEEFKNVDCYWCRHPFNTRPIGCPIRYVSNQLVKTYYSEISKDKYIIKENITLKKSKKLKEFSKNSSNLGKLNTHKKSPSNKSEQDDESDNKSITESSLKLIKNDYYVTDGIFCSFNCTKSFILDNKHKTMYDCSNRLLIQMYNYIFGTKISNIKEADDWRLLKKAGGILDIDVYRKNFNHVNYEYHGYISDICKPIGHLWEEHIRL